MASKSSRNSPRYPANANKRPSGKKPLPEPTHFGHFISILIISGCKKILHIDTAVKIGIYLCGVLVGSVLSDILAFPRTYFSDRKNIMNRVFVKFGFGWTFVLLLLFIFMTSFVYTCGNWKNVIRKHCFRLILSTIWWFALTKIFIYIDSVVGVCSASSHKHKLSCMKAGKAWLGFDISGHVFLLIHNLLTISEEVKTFKYWAALDSLLKEDLTSRRNITQQELSQARISYKALTPFIKLVIVLLALWTIFCEFMLIISVVYRFHTMTQKVAAAFVAVGCWFVNYRILLELDIGIFPTQPGQGPLNFMKVKQQ